MKYDNLLQAIIDIGEEMVVAGAEVNRVEESIERMSRSYGFDRINVFVIVSNLQVTAQAPDGRIITHIRYIVRNDVNFDRLDYLNDLSRYVCANCPDPDQIQEKITEVMNRKQFPWWFELMGSIFAASGFAVFFGGTLWDGLAAAIFGAGICLLQYALGRTQLNTVASNLLVSLLTGLAIGVVSGLIPALHMDKIMIGDIMLMIPGLAMTNALRNMLVGNTISGTMRLAESLIWAASLAGGFMVALAIVERIF